MERYPLRMSTIKSHRSAPQGKRAEPSPLWLAMTLGIFFVAAGLMFRKSWREVTGANERGDTTTVCPLGPIQDVYPPDPFPSTSQPGCIMGWPRLNRFSRRLRPLGSTKDAPRPVRLAVEKGLQWLADQQCEDGSWRADYVDLKPAGNGWRPLHDTGRVGTTSLALLAFLGDHSTTRMGRYRATVRRAVIWIGHQQDSETGFIGIKGQESSAIHHAMACLALADNYYDSHNPFQKLQAKRALNYIERSQNLDGGWHQEKRCREALDSLLVSWNLLALESGHDSRLRFDPFVLMNGLAWLQANTDPVSGRIGPDPCSDNAPFTVEGLRSKMRLSDSMTRAGWFAQIVANQPVERHALMQVHACQARLNVPAWRPDELVDWQGWLFGTQLMFQVEGEYWEPWNEALMGALIPHQSTGENLHGSWPPGLVGDRVQSTALALLALQVPHHFNQLLTSKPKH